MSHGSSAHKNNYMIHCLVKRSCLVHGDKLITGLLSLLREREERQSIDSLAERLTRVATSVARIPSLRPSSEGQESQRTRAAARSGGRKEQRRTPWRLSCRLCLSRCLSPINVFRQTECTSTWPLSLHIDDLINMHLRVLQSQQ